MVQHPYPTHRWKMMVGTGNGFSGWYFHQFRTHHPWFDADDCSQFPSPGKLLLPPRHYIAGDKKLSQRWWEPLECQEYKDSLPSKCLLWKQETTCSHFFGWLFTVYDHSIPFIPITYHPMLLDVVLVMSSLLFCLFLLREYTCFIHVSCFARFCIFVTHTWSQN